MQYIDGIILHFSVAYTASTEIMKNNIQVFKMKIVFLTCDIKLIMLYGIWNAKISISPGASQNKKCQCLRKLPITFSTQVKKESFWWVFYVDNIVLALLMLK